MVISRLSALFLSVLLGLPLASVADNHGIVISGGGESTFSADVDGDGDADGSYFGIGVALADDQPVGHFIYGMWGNTDVVDFPLLAVEAQVTGIEPSVNPDEYIFSGTGTLNLGRESGGEDDLQRDVPFLLKVVPGGPNQGWIQLTILGRLDGLLGDTIEGNGDLDLPAQSISSGQIDLLPMAVTETVELAGPHTIGGGGLTTFNVDLDEDGDVDGAYFGLSIDQQEDAVTGHFVCAMWGDTEYWGLPIMALEGIVDQAELDTNDEGFFDFSGVGTVDLGEGNGFFIDVPFRVTAGAGGPEEGTIQLTIVGVLDGVPGDLILGNNACDLPTETISSGLIAIGGTAVTPTAILEKMGSETPDHASLGQNVPNPFNPSTAISFDVRQSGRAVLTVLDVLGRNVAVLVDENLSPGRYMTEWQPGAEAGSGVYFYQLRTGDSVLIKKMLLIK